eukprot:3591656-Rhodomonas_salina.1
MPLSGVRRSCDIAAKKCSCASSCRCSVRSARFSAEMSTSVTKIAGSADPLSTGSNTTLCHTSSSTPLGPMFFLHSNSMRDAADLICVYSSRFARESVHVH